MMVLLRPQIIIQDLMALLKPQIIIQDSSDGPAQTTNNN
jgi:hypothetical protein